MSDIKDQPPPKTNNNEPVWNLVVRDMQDRDKLGYERYGTRLQAFNGRNSQVDAYQEVLDLSVYLRQSIEERSKMVEVLKHYASNESNGLLARELLSSLGEM